MSRSARRIPLIIGLGLAACSAPEPVAPPPAPPPSVTAPIDIAPVDTPPIEPTPTTLPELLTGIEAAYRKGDYDRGLALVKRVFELGSADVTALDRVGSIYYVLGRYGEALTIWQRALPLEKSPRRRRELSRSIAVARRTLGLPAEGPPAAAATPRPKPAKTPVRRPPDQGVIDALYRKGVKHYARGEFLQATSDFLRILELDPGNQRAAKAMERLHLEGAAAP